ncbi:MAG: hypothetical protein V4709_01605 [Pseudomonadota bacterium]
MLVPAVNSALRRRTELLAALMIGLVPQCFAQAGYDSLNQFGDRQIGHWGDPGSGYFGNPAVGNFDNSVLREPAPGTKPMGKVNSGKPVEPSPYVSLPAPKDAAPQPAGGSKAATVKPAKKKSPAKKKTAG